MDSNIMTSEAGLSIHYADMLCLNKAVASIGTLLSHLNEFAARPLVYICIGTDKATGDCLGPLVGTRLKMLLPAAPIYGTLQSPVHALNLARNIKEIQGDFPDPFIIAIDACLGNADRIGFINIKPGGLMPGSALHKDLPCIGDFHISGVVNTAGYFQHLILQNTRLFLVDQMAEMIAKSLFLAQYRFMGTINHI